MPLIPTLPAEQLVLLTNAVLKGPKTVFAVLCIFAKELPKHGRVVELTAPQRAAASTATCNRLFAHTIQAVCIMPRMNTITGSAINPNSTAAVPRVFWKKDFIY